MKTLSKLKPFMCYIPDSQYNRLKKFSMKENLPMSQLMREAIELRIAKGNPYVTGHNEGLTKAIKAVADHKAAQMRFPSGKSFAELFEETLEPLKLKEDHANQNS